VLIYDQTCATEKRRRRKRGAYPDPAKRAFINDAVCEGCGDCSVQSNCLSVEPLETPLGTKRKINQSSCNKDFSCVKGFCPSFITAEGAQVKKPGGAAQGNNRMPDFAALTAPRIEPLVQRYGILVTGVGGTGVVTIGGLIGMAAHLEGKGVVVLDMAGLAQKGGAVLSHIQLAPTPGALHATRIGTGEARLIIGCDAIVSASPEVLSKTRLDVTRAAINSGATPTAEFVKNPHWVFPGAQTEHDLRANIGGQCAFIDANQLALTLLGDTIYANPLLLGYVWQKGWLPLSYAGLLRAIKLNGVAVEKNRLAFDWGRYIAEHGAQAADQFAPKQAHDVAQTQAVVLPLPQSVEKLVETRAQMLVGYQSERYAARYRNVVERLRARESQIGADTQMPLTRAVAQNLAKLMSYKDEYEVARLYADPAYLGKLRAQFEGEPGKDYTLSFYLAPPLLAKRDEHGHLVKRRFGPWVLPMFRVLAKLKGARGGVFDIFGKTAERRMERQLVEDYITLVETFCASLNADNLAVAIRLAKLPDEIRGFGHVKERNVLAVAEKRQTLMTEYAQAGGPRQPNESQEERLAV
jgi:indolepyruvate ferredoxin oxidoreductase